MDAVFKKPAKPAAQGGAGQRPSREEAEAAVRTLIAWAGDDPTREGLQDTPRRVVSAYEEFYAGYRQDPNEALDRTFEDVGTYDDVVFESITNQPARWHRPVSSVATTGRP